MVGRSRRDAARLVEVDHTADVGFAIEAETIEGLFRAAAEGLCRILGGDRHAPAGEEETERIRLDRPDLERLLVAWLREILVSAQVEGALPSVERIEVRLAGGEPGGPCELDALLRWRTGAAPTREVKAVTYHGLRIEREEGSWKGRVILDV